MPVKFGKKGAEEAYPVGTLSGYEKQGLAKAVEELRGNVKKGEDFVKA